MPLTEVRASVAARINELWQVHRVISRNENNIPVPPEHTALKGFFIVGLYAAVEFSLQQIIRAVASQINSVAAKHKHLTHDVMVIVADPIFTSGAVMSGERKWQRRLDLLHSISSDEKCLIQESILGKEIQNTRRSTIELAFKLFGVTGQAFIDPVVSRYIDDIGERRNAVAHGRESAAEVGGRFTAGGLEDRLTRLDQQITLMILNFEDMLDRKTYIKPTCRRFYP